MVADPEIVRNSIAREYEQANKRMDWFLMLQLFLFAAVALAWDEGVAPSVVLAAVGVLSALFVGVLLRVGILAVERLRESSGAGGETALGWRYRQSSRVVQLLLPWQFLPHLFMAAWSVVIVIRVLGVGADS